MNQPMPAPRTISDAKCCLTAKRDKQTVLASAYAVIGTTSGRGYSCATTEAKAQEVMACPEGKLELDTELFPEKNDPRPSPSSGRSRCVASLTTVTTISAFAKASNPRMPVSRK